MELQELILDYKNKHHITNNEIAKRLHVTKSTVSKWLSGDVKNVQKETLEKMTKVFGYDVEALLKGKVIQFKKPIIGYVKAGYDLFADENYLGEEEVTALENREGDYFLQVTGDSMIGEGIMDGSLVYVRQCSTVPNYSIAVVLIGREEVTIKRVIQKENMLILESANPQVPTRYYTSEEVIEEPIQILGQVLYAKTRF